MHRSGVRIVNREPESIDTPPPRGDTGVFAAQRMAARLQSLAPLARASPYDLSQSAPSGVGRIQTFFKELPR
jgi:hypothetical protein